MDLNRPVVLSLAHVTVRGMHPLTIVVAKNTTTAMAEADLTLVLSAILNRVSCGLKYLNLPLSLSMSRGLRCRP